MKVKIEYVKNPMWCEDGVRIDALVKFSNFDEPIPFTANPNDPVDYGQALYRDLIAEKFGKVAEYQPPVVTRKQKASEVRTERDFLLSSVVDPIVTNPLRWGDLTESEQQEFVDYRKALLDITDQPNFPWDIEWPEKPSKSP